ncbi:hypothetical protein MLD38_000006 [Melastoma candidum]|uniref:Uncharacterized protein n=1 Tax=Melastoma candidum TaxID=119954 RepID=A0ACB9S8R2_9MYRT|nr:hypothetical protein MLD38_000006 [Melastoma candidum]
MTSDSSLKMGEMSTRTSSNVGKFRVTAARAESGKVSLGFRAPQFELTEPLSGKSWKLEDFEGYPALLVMFICNHCPFVKHLKKDIVKLTNFYMKWLRYHQTLSAHTHRMDRTSWHKRRKHLTTLSLIYMTSPRVMVCHSMKAIGRIKVRVHSAKDCIVGEVFWEGDSRDTRDSVGSCRRRWWETCSRLLAWPTCSGPEKRAEPQEHRSRYLEEIVQVVWSRRRENLSLDRGRRLLA